MLQGPLVGLIKVLGDLLDSELGDLRHVLVLAAGGTESDHFGPALRQDPG